jgi:hypothetical protein
MLQTIKLLTIPYVVRKIDDTTPLVNGITGKEIPFLKNTEMFCCKAKLENYNESPAEVLLVFNHSFITWYCMEDQSMLTTHWSIEERKDRWKLELEVLSQHKDLKNVKIIH